MFLIPHVVLIIFSNPILLPHIQVHGVPTNEIHSTSYQSGNSWTGLSDILELSRFDADWQAEVDSGFKIGNNEHIKTSTNENQASIDKKKQPTGKRIRNTPEDRLKQKFYRQHFDARIQSNPELFEKYKAKRRIWNATSRYRRLSKMTESEKEAYKLHRKQAKIKYQLSIKQKFGGFSSEKAQRLSTIRKMKIQGNASEQDLKFLHDHQQKARETYQRRRNSKKTI